MAKNLTDYQASYPAYTCIQRRKLRKPLPKLRNPHPPPMDFRTVQRLEFIERKLEDGMTKSCKVSFVLFQKNFYSVSFLHSCLSTTES